MPSSIHFQIVCTVAIAMLSGLSLAQDTPHPASSPAKSEAEHPDIEIVAGVYKDKLAKSKDAIPISVTVKNNSKEAFSFANDESRSSFGISVLALNSSNAGKTIIPRSSQNTQQLDAWIISVPAGQSVTFPLARPIPVDVLNASYSGYMLCIHAQTGSSKGYVLLYSKPFSIPSPSSK